MEISLFYVLLLLSHVSVCHPRNGWISVWFAYWSFFLFIQRLFLFSSSCRLVSPSRSPPLPSLVILGTHPWMRVLRSSLSVLPLYGSVFIFLAAIPLSPPPLSSIPRPGILLFPLFSSFLSAAPTVFFGGWVEADVMFVTRKKVYCRGECALPLLCPLVTLFFYYYCCSYSSLPLVHHSLSSHLFVVLVFIVCLHFCLFALCIVCH